MKPISCAPAALIISEWKKKQTPVFRTSTQNTRNAVPRDAAILSAGYIISNAQTLNQ